MVNLYPGKLKELAKAQQRAAKKAAIMADEERLATYRERLDSLSWLMRCIIEPIAKQSNAEDFCKGHFYEYHPWYSSCDPSSFLRCSNWFQTNMWESRFRSQSLLDEAAAITCMAYIDLNPIRSGIAKTPEEPARTSIQHRLINMTEEQLESAVAAIESQVRERPLTIKLKDYIELVEWVVFCVLQKLHTLHPCK